MSERDEILTYLGLPAGASLSEIESAYNWRAAAAGDRLAAGDESARIELAALKEAYERLTGRSPLRLPVRTVQTESGGEYAPPEETYPRMPAWWSCYLSFLLALGSLAALVVLVAYLPHVYRRGGFLIPLALLVSGALLSILATMLADAELQHHLRARLLAHKRLDTDYESVPLRGYTARVSSLLSRAVRWLIALALIATVLLNFASLSGRWSLRH